MSVRVRYPKASSLRVVHVSGETRVVNSAGLVDVTQKSGMVRIEGSSGSVEGVNREGDIVIEDNLGFVHAVAEHGSIRANRSVGEISLEGRRGKIVIDAPRGKVRTHNTGGDVRIIALEGVFGDFDVMVENGNISMVMPPTSDAWVFLNVVDGSIYSSIPVTGSHEKNSHTFQGRLNKATHRVVLEAHQGNVVLD